MYQILMKPKVVLCFRFRFVMGFRIFVRSVLILKQSLFQSVLKIKVFLHAKGKTIG